MDINKQSKMQSSVTAAEFSSSQSYSTSFSSMRQSMATHQSKMLVNELQSNFSQMSMGNQNNRISLMDQFMNSNPNDQMVIQNKFGPMNNGPNNQSMMNTFFKQNSQDDSQLDLPNKFKAIEQFSPNPNTNTDLVLKSNFQELDNSPNGQLSLMEQFMNAKTYKEKKLLFQSNLLSPTSEEYNNFFRDRTFSNVANISMTQTRAAQMSKTQVTKTVMNKIIKKKIIRKIVNGEVVEEEEEIDEIENEPTTERFVMNNARNFENIDMNVDLGNGGKFFDNMALESPAFRAEGNSGEVKAIEAPKPKTGIKGIFSLGKKSKPDFKNVGKLELIIDELFKTEENYVKDLLLVVEEFMPELERYDAPPEIRGSQRLLLFGNIEIICMFHDVQFLTDLRECDKNPDDVASCFLKHRKEFSLYRHFNRNQPLSELYLGKYEPFFQSKANQLGLLNLRSYLIKPTQRLCRYILLMEELSKECKKYNIKAKDVEDAVDLLKKEIRLGNDLMALDAIKDCNMDLKDQGDLIFRNQFTVQKGKETEYKAMVFLFEKIMLFTEVKLENNLDILYYKDFIYLHEIGLTECSNDSKKFKVWFHKHTSKQYTLRTTDKETKKKWVNEIRKQLENQLVQSKKKQETKRTLIDLKTLNKDKIKKDNK